MGENLCTIRTIQHYLPMPFVASAYSHQLLYIRVICQTLVATISPMCLLSQFPNAQATHVHHRFPLLRPRSPALASPSASSTLSNGTSSCKTDPSSHSATPQPHMLLCDIPSDMLSIILSFMSRRERMHITYRVSRAFHHATPAVTLTSCCTTVGNTTQTATRISLSGFSRPHAARCESRISQYICNHLQHTACIKLCWMWCPSSHSAYWI